MSNGGAHDGGSVLFSSEWAKNVLRFFCEWGLGVNNMDGFASIIPEWLKSLTHWIGTQLHLCNVFFSYLIDLWRFVAGLFVLIHVTSHHPVVKYDGFSAFSVVWMLLSVHVFFLGGGDVVTVGATFSTHFLMNTVTESVLSSMLFPEVTITNVNEWCFDGDIFQVGKPKRFFPLFFLPWHNHSTSY